MLVCIIGVLAIFIRQKESIEGAILSLCLADYQLDRKIGSESIGAFEVPVGASDTVQSVINLEAEPQYNVR